MLWKLLFTVVAILGAYLVIRARVRPRPEPGLLVTARPARLPRRLTQGLAYALAGLALAASGFYLVHSWDQGREVLRVQVINVNTGLIANYQARQRDIKGRGFRTLDGQVVRLADVERMVLVPADRLKETLIYSPQPLPAAPDL